MHAYSLPVRKRLLNLVGFWLLSSLVWVTAHAAEAIKKSFDLPADALDKSLKRFSAVSGVEVLYPTDAVAGVRTQPVRGEMTARQAIEGMLIGTGFGVFQDPRSGAFTVRKAGDHGTGPTRSGTQRDPKKNEPSEAERPMKRNGILTSIVAAVSLLGTPGAKAADGTGAIQGRVFNPVSKNYVRNAEVRVESAGLVAYTENDGSFQFPKVPAGEVTVTVNYIGYNPEKQTFQLSAGQTVTREFNLTSTAAGLANDGVVQLQAFTVLAEREGNAKAIQAQRRDLNIITSVSSDLFGDVADGNVGEFVKYLPGVDIDYVESEARGPRLAGFDSAYVGVSVDGMRTASADALQGGSRGTSFEGFSITSIESIEINWTSGPENDADTPAGFINMRTKRAFDRKGRELTYNLSTSLNSEEFTLGRTPGPPDKKDRKWGPNYILSYSDTFFDQKVGILLSASHAFSFTEQIEETAVYNTSPLAHDPRPMVVQQLTFRDGPKFIIKDALLLTADWKATPRLTLSLNASYAYAEGEFWNRNLQFVFANNTSSPTVANGRSSIGGDGVNTLIATRVASGSTPTSQTNNVANVNIGGGAAAKLTYTRQYVPSFEYRLGDLTVDGSFGYSYSKNNYEALERGFSTSAAGSVPSSFTAERAGPGAWEWTFRQTSGADWFDLRNFESPPTVRNDDRTFITEKYTGMANARYELPWLKSMRTVVKVGGKWDEEGRDENNLSNWSNRAYIGPGGNTATYNPATETWSLATRGNVVDLGPQYISSNPFETGKSNALTIHNINGVKGTGVPWPSLNALADLHAAHPEQFVNTGTVENFFNSFFQNKRNFKQTITAGYGQADTRITPKLQLRYGARWEDTKNEVIEFNPLTAAQMLNSPFASQFTRNATTGIVTPSRATSISGILYQYTSQPRITRTSKYDKFFPSLSAKYNILPNLEWHVGFNKSIGRPNIRTLAGLWTVDEAAQRVTAPNPNLKPEYHKKLLTRLGYYFGGRSPGQLSLMLSKTQFTNMLQTTDFTAAEFGNTDPDFSNYTFRSSRNISDVLVTFKNLSLGYRQTLGFLPSEYLSGTTVFFNYDRTYISQSGVGSIRVDDVAPHRISSGIGYRFRKFNAGLNMVWIDDRPEGAYGRYQRHTTRFDMTMGYAVSRKFGVFLQGRNITNDKDMYFISPLGYAEGTNGHLRLMDSFGANWSFGVKGTF